MRVKLIYEELSTSTAAKSKGVLSIFPSSEKRSNLAHKNEKTSKIFYSHPKSSSLNFFSLNYFLNFIFSLKKIKHFYTHQTEIFKKIFSHLPKTKVSKNFNKNSFIRSSRKYLMHEKKEVFCSC